MLIAASLVLAGCKAKQAAPADATTGTTATVPAQSAAPASQAQPQVVRPRYYDPADTARSRRQLGNQELYAPHTLIIMYDGKDGKKNLMKAVKAYGATVIYDYKIINGIAISLPEDRDLHQARAWFQKVKGVLSVNYDQIYHLDGAGKARLQ